MKKNILLVEDDVFLQQLYLDLLTQEGYTITVSGEGNDAKEKIVRGTWDLVLLDVMLPGKDGFTILDEVIKKMKKVSFPIIFLTNLNGSQEDKRELEKADNYWIKSDMSPPEFIKKVSAIFTSS
ncbi:MAG: response regulator [bacterium]|nr:response regulator [bacterium]